LTTDKGWRRPFDDPNSAVRRARARHDRGCRDLHHEAAESDQQPSAHVALG
jgi:hypothetical protein